MRKIAIISGKGGVGKTTTTANLSAIFSERYVDCVAVDANLGAPNLGLHLNLVKAPFDIADVISGKVKFDDSSLLSQYGVRVLPASMTLSDKNKRTMFAKLPRVFSKIRSAFILVDCPPGVNEDTQKILKACSEVVVITTPDMPSVTAGAQVIEQARKMNRKVTGIILNRVNRKGYEMTSFEVSQMCGANILATIPECSFVPESIASRTPLVKYKPNTLAAQSFQALASQLLGQPYTAPKRNLLQRIINFIQDVVGW